MTRAEYTRCSRQRNFGQEHIDAEMSTSIALQVESSVESSALFQACYPIKSIPKGLMLIINNTSFADRNRHPERLGSNEDVRNLLQTFGSRLKFRISLEDDLSSEVCHCLLHVFRKCVRKWSFVTKHTMKQCLLPNVV